MEFFRQVNGSWRHASPDERFLGEKMVLESEHFYIEGHERETDLMMGALVRLELLYRQMTGALQTEFPPGERLVIKILPSVTSLRFDNEAMEVSVPSPYFGAWKDDLDASYFVVRTLSSLFARLAFSVDGLSEDLVVLVARYGIWGYVVLDAWQSQVIGPGFQYEWDHRLRDAVPLASAIRSDELLTLVELGQVWFGFRSSVSWSKDKSDLAYQEAAVVMGYIAETYGSQAFPELLRLLPEVCSMEGWLRLALGVDLETFETDWRAWLREQWARQSE